MFEHGFSALFLDQIHNMPDGYIYVKGPEEFKSIAPYKTCTSNVPLLTIMVLA